MPISIPINLRNSLLIAALLTGTAVASAASDQKFTREQELGRLLFKDPRLSINRNQACNSCHSLAPVKLAKTKQRLGAAGFVDEDNVKFGSAVSDGSINGAQGTLNAPSVGYAAFSPHFHWDGNEGLYVGGQFWNGRADTLAEQAEQPILNPVEMAMPSKWAAVTRLKENHTYVRLFKKIYRIDLDVIPAYENAPANLLPPPGVDSAYAKMAQAIAAFQQSRRFNQFTSKFDFVIAGVTEFTALEAKGFGLFQSKAQCSACHVSAVTVAPDGSDFPPLFTDFTYDNIGVPRNWNIPDSPAPDRGLGGRSDIAAKDPLGNELGKHKVMSLRNIAITPPYAHNGVFENLAQIVHFYNTRDTLGRVIDNNDPGFGINGWPEPEVGQNVNTEELGDLGLSNDEEAALVAFLKTLTDGYPRWGHDPKVPPGTASPYATTPFPPFP